MLKPFFEPVDPDEDNSRVNEYGAGHHRYTPDHNLLVGSQVIQIHGIQSALGGGRTCKKQSVGIGHILGRVYNNRSHDRPQNDICIMDGYESEAEYAPDISSQPCVYGRTESAPEAPKPAFACHGGDGGHLLRSQEDQRV